MSFNLRQCVIIAPVSLPGNRLVSVVVGSFLRQLPKPFRLVELMTFAVFFVSLTGEFSRIVTVRQNL